MADVEVAMILANDGVEVATMAPDELVERTMSEFNPENVMVPVAVRLEAVTVPSKTASPATERSLYGEVVPSPRFPEEFTLNISEYESEPESERDMEK